jgi:hypothetical protein
MPHTISLARDHLQHAVTILQGQDNQSRQLRYIIERTISLMDDIRVDLGPLPTPSGNVLDLAAFRARQAETE